MPHVAMLHETDPKKVILDQVGELPAFKDLFYSNILVGIYVRPKVTAKGILMPDQHVEEDIYQGKVGLVLKVGNTAFQDTDDIKFNGQKVEVGDWVMFRASDGLSVSVNKTPCRILSDVAIKAVISDPDLLF